MLSKSEQRVLRTFDDFLVAPGEMLCFYGPDLERNRAALKTLAEKDLIVKERFKGGYSLTPEGFAVMKDATK